MAFLWHDVRDAWRSLVRWRGYTLLVVSTLTLGIGVNTAIFTVVDALLFKSLPYAEADRLVLVAEWPSSGGNYTMAPAAYLRWRGEVRSFTHFEARIGVGLALVGDGDPEELRAARVTPGYFDMLGVRAAIGRSFVRDDAAPGRPCVAVISHRLWVARFAGDASRVGTPVRFSGGTCTVIGVLPAESVLNRGAFDAYVPLTPVPGDGLNQGRMWTVMARLAPGVTLEHAGAEMRALAAAFNPGRGRAGEGWTTAVTPLRDIVVRADSRWLAWVLFGAVSVVLFVACLNVAGLSLSRTYARRREVAVRTALGASRWRVFRHLLIESLVAALAGGAGGFLLGSWGLRVFTALVPAGILPSEAAASLDGRALLFTGAVSMASGLLFGTLPAWRGTSASPVEALSEGGRTSSSSRLLARAQSALLVVEISMAMVLVVTAAALVTSLVRLMRVDPGFSPQHVLTFRVTLPGARYQSNDAAARFFEQALDAIHRVRGVQHAGAVTSLPLGGWRFGTRFTVVGVPGDPARPTSAHIQHTTAGYFEALGLTLAAGRPFSPDDHARAPLVAIVNETFVKRFIAGERVIGRQLRLGIGSPAGPEALWEIVGVIRNVKTGGLADLELATPEIYVPHPQSPMPSMFVAVRTAGGADAALLPDVRAAVRSVDPELPIGGVMTMDERVGTSLGTARFRAAMIGASALLAAFLASLGVYAVRSQAVAARIREVGIRVALGATRAQILAMILIQGLRLVLTGVTLGLVAAAMLERAVAPWLYATRITDPALMAGTAAMLAAAAIVASWAPARRASAADPLTLLHHE